MDYDSTVGVFADALLKSGNDTPSLIVFLPVLLGVESLMVFTIDFLSDGRVLEWESTADSAVVNECNNYTSRIYVGSRNPTVDVDLSMVQTIYNRRSDVSTTEIVTQRPGFRRDEGPVLAVDVTHIDRVVPVARQAQHHSQFPVGDLACFNVDLSREFRYCLENDIDPTPANDLSTLRLGVPVSEMDGAAYSELSIDDSTVTGSPADLLTAVQLV